MKHAKPARHEHRHKPLAEEYQTVIACTVLIVAIFGVVFTLGYFFPPDTAPMPVGGGIYKAGALK